MLLVSEAVRGVLYQTRYLLKFFCDEGRQGETQHFSFRLVVFFIIVGYHMLPPYFEVETCQHSFTIFHRYWYRSLSILRFNSPTLLLHSCNPPPPSLPCLIIRLKTRMLVTSSYCGYASKTIVTPSALRLPVYLPLKPPGIIPDCLQRILDFICCGLAAVCPPHTPYHGTLGVGGHLAAVPLYSRRRRSRCYSGATRHPARADEGAARCACLLGCKAMARSNGRYFSPCPCYRAVG